VAGALSRVEVRSSSVACDKRPAAERGPPALEIRLGLFSNITHHQHAGEPASATCACSSFSVEVPFDS